METRKLGRYEIISELGKGAMGVVYKAADPMLDRIVAVKTINMSLEQDEMAEYEARFYQEAKAAGGLNHPNVVIVYDIGKAGNIAYMAMEFLEGKELRTVLTPGSPLPVKQAIDIAAQVADGLAYAHEHQVVHRDIKPANIMIVRNGLAKITDFGIARMRSAEVKTQTGMVMGSPKYMSPEQVLGKRADQRSDIFSLGIVLYEMLTGAAPFTGENINAIMFNTVNLIPPAPSLINSAVPRMLDYIAAKALAKKLDERYQSAKDLANDLRECEKQLQAGPATISPTTGTLESFPEHLTQTLMAAEEETQPLNEPHATTRSDDATAEAAGPPPTLGVSKVFDSFEATMRLAAETDMAQELEDFAKTRKITRPASTAAMRPATASGAQRLTPMPQPAPEAAKWNRRDKLIFGASVLLALIIAAALALS